MKICNIYVTGRRGGAGTDGSAGAGALRSLGEAPKLERRYVTTY